MRGKYFYISFGVAMAAWSPSGSAREIVALPGVDNSVGQLSGIDTTGSGTLTIGAGDNINTSNDLGGGITSSAANTARVLFLGSSTITGFTGTVGATLLDIRAGVAGSTVTFNGPVFATTFSVVGTGTVTFNGGFTSNSGDVVDFAGDGLVNLGAGQTLSGAITNTAGANFGTLTLNGGSTVVGAVGAASGLKRINVVGGNAAITGAVKAYSFDLGANTLAITGALTLPASSTINTTIANSVVYGKIVPSGFSTVGTGLQVNVIVNSVIANGSSYDIVSATSGSSGSVVTATDTSARYLFSASNPATGIVRITVDRVPLTTIVAPPGGGDPGLGPVATTIDNTPGLSIQDPLSSLPTAAAVARAVAQLVPGQVVTSTNMVNFQAISEFQDQWASRLDSVQDRCRFEDRANIPAGTKAECKGSSTRDNWWAKGFGNFGNQGASGGFGGYDSQILGGMIGYDAPLENINPDIRVGLGVGYAYSTLNAQNSNNNSHIGTYQATGYVGFAPGPWFVDGAVTVGWDQYGTKRNISFPGYNRTADADFSGQQYTGMVTSGIHIPVAFDSTLTPLASLQYTHLSLDSYRENNAGDINLNVNSQGYDFVESGLGLKLAHPVFVTDGTFIPDVHTKWLHAFSGQQMKNTATFAGGGPSFTTIGQHVDADTYDVGAGLTFITCNCSANNWGLEAVYDYQWRADNYSAHQGILKFTYRF